MTATPADLRPTTSVTAGHALTEARVSLAGSDTAALDAHLLLGHVLGRGRAWLLSHRDAELSADHYAAFVSLVERRAGGEPVAYLRGHVEWMDLDLHVSHQVLIPRPETESLTAKAIELALRIGAQSIADIGTGSGAIAIALARALQSVTILAIDMSDGALSVAAQNVATYGLQERVRLIRGSMLEPLTEAPDVLVANLPYLSQAMMETIGNDVRHEPVTALFAGHTGIERYQELATQMAIRRWSVPLIGEIDPRQAGIVVGMLSAVLPTGRVELHPDLSGRTRIVLWLPDGLETV